MCGWKQTLHDLKPGICLRIKLWKLASAGRHGPCTTMASQWAKMTLLMHWLCLSQGNLPAESQTSDGRRLLPLEKHSVWWSYVRSVWAKMISLNAALAHVKYIFIWLAKAPFGVPIAEYRRHECPLHYANCLSTTVYYFSQRGNVDQGGGKGRAQTQFSSFWEAITNRWEAVTILHVGWLISRTEKAAGACAVKSRSGSKLTSLQRWFKNSNGNSAAKQNNETKSNGAQKRHWPNTMLFHWVSYFHSKPKFQNVSLINRGDLKG